MGKEIHDRSSEFGGTYKWAINMGFSPEQADIMAKACNKVDWDPVINPITGQVIISIQIPEVLTQG